MKKILVISTQTIGGCFIYADKIISNFNSDVEIAMPDKVYEVYDTKPDWTFKYYGSSGLARIFSCISLLLKVFFKGIVGKYDSLLLFGITKLDYYILKIWTLCHGRSFIVIHDGKMHKGEENDAFVKQTIRMMKLCTAIIYLSEFVRNLTLQNFGIDKPYIIAPHGLIDYGQIAGNNAHINGRPVLLFLGRVSKYKGIELLLDALKKVDKSMFKEIIIAGKWSYERPEISSELKVRIIDKWLSDSEIISLISTSDIMLFPYIEASQSGVATVAINYLKPSIVTSVGAFKEQFGENAAIFSEPKSSDLALAITRLCQNPDLRNSIINNLKLLKSRYSWKQIANNLETSIRTSQF